MMANGRGCGRGVSLGYPVQQYHGTYIASSVQRLARVTQANLTAPGPPATECPSGHRTHIAAGNRRAAPLLSSFAMLPRLATPPGTPQRDRLDRRCTP